MKIFVHIVYASLSQTAKAQSSKNWVRVVDLEPTANKGSGEAYGRKENVFIILF